MYTDLMDHPCELTTFDKIFFTLVVKAGQVKLDSLTLKSTTCALFFFICVVNEIP